MNVRNLTRNIGWWRLFVVSACLWYGSWLIASAVNWYTTPTWEDLTVAIYTLDELMPPLTNADQTQNAKLAKILANRIQCLRFVAELHPSENISVEVNDLELGLISKYADDPNPSNAACVVDAETERRLSTVVDGKPDSFAGRYQVIGIIEILLAPWAVFFSFRLGRWVVEGFASTT